MALNDLVDKFQAAADANATIKHFHAGDLSDINTLTSKQFPLFILAVDTGTHNVADNQATYPVKAYIFNTYKTEDKKLKNQHETWADLKAAGLSVWVSAMTAPDYIYEKENLGIDFFKESFKARLSFCEISSDVIVAECIT